MAGFTVISEISFLCLLLASEQLPAIKSLSAQSRHKANNFNVKLFYVSLAIFYLEFTPLFSESVCAGTDPQPCDWLWLWHWNLWHCETAHEGLLEHSESPISIE